jgi:hypothetical protein
MHIGEPLACWQPLDPQDPHYGYYSSHPEWHLYGKPGYPSHRELMDARDRVLAKHPRLRAVGAHLGSLEYDVAEVARRLERYPNFAVDTSARLADLACQDGDIVRQFFLHYQDRILFGTDLVQRVPQSSLSDETRCEVLEWMGARYRSEFDYFESQGQVEVRGREARGLGLPEKVLTKLYSANARAWYGLQ